MAFFANPEFPPPNPLGPKINPKNPTSKKSKLTPLGQFPLKFHHTEDLPNPEAITDKVRYQSFHIQSQSINIQTQSRGPANPPDPFQEGQLSPSELHQKIHPKTRQNLHKGPPKILNGLPNLSKPPNPFFSPILNHCLLPRPNFFLPKRL
jgi:hypothetical protein